MSLKLLPRESLPREKLISHGSPSLTDAELLAIFLRTGIPGMNAIQLADHILKHFVTLRALFDADCQQFCAIKGLGVAKYVQLQAVMEMTQRYLAETLQRGEGLTSPEQTKLYLLSCLRHQSQEMFDVLFLDNQHRIICHEHLFTGTIDCASVYPREVVKRSLEVNAAAVIFAHNHPSGVAEPSQADRRITRRLSDALSLVEINVLDHFVIGDG